jgi:hypothetical protein
MHIDSDLGRLQAISLRRVSRIRTTASRISLGSPKSEQQTGVAYAVIELHNLWYSFSRHLYLSAVLGAKDPSGAKIAILVPRPTSVDDALTPAIRLRPSHRSRKPPWSWADEPPWAKPQVLLDSLHAVGASNESKVSAGVSTTGTVFSELTTFRNFFAHRGKDTFLRLPPLLRAHSFPSDLKPSQALLSNSSMLGTKRPQALLLDWVDEIEDAISLSI